MSGVRIVLVGVLGGACLAGCAKGAARDDVDGRGFEHVDGDPDIDAKVEIDGVPLPDAPPHIDAPPAPDAMPGCTVQTTDLLVNGPFDGGTAPWTEGSPYPIIGAPPSGLTANTAPNVAWLGGYDNGSDRLYQDVAIPATTSAITLRGFLLIDTSEPSGVYDYGEIGFLTTSDTVLVMLGTWDNSQATGGTFVSQNLPSPDPYAGQTIRVEIEAQTDISNPSSFIWDSLALDVTVCQ